MVPVYRDKNNTPALQTQLLFGECFKVIDTTKYWIKIRVVPEGAEGWISRLQFCPISKDAYEANKKGKNGRFSGDLFSLVRLSNNHILTVPFGSVVSNVSILDATFEGTLYPKRPDKSKLVQSALYYLNVPELKGGKTPFGIDSAGLVQLIYRLGHIDLPRTAASQAKHGEPLSFIEESDAGDLAFFDDKEGVINHVGIIMKNNYILHVHGCVRIDRLDHTGIYNNDSRQYSHSLRVIKKLSP